MNNFGYSHNNIKSDYIQLNAKYELSLNELLTTLDYTEDKLLLVLNNMNETFRFILNNSPFLLSFTINEHLENAYKLIDCIGSNKILDDYKSKLHFNLEILLVCITNYSSSIDLRNCPINKEYLFFILKELSKGNRDYEFLSQKITSFEDIKHFPLISEYIYLKKLLQINSSTQHTVDNLLLSKSEMNTLLKDHYSSVDLLIQIVNFIKSQPENLYSTIENDLKTSIYPQLMRLGLYSSVTPSESLAYLNYMHENIQMENCNDLIEDGLRQFTRLSKYDFIDSNKHIRVLECLRSLIKAEYSNINLFTNDLNYVVENISQKLIGTILEKTDIRDMSYLEILFILLMKNYSKDNEKCDAIFKAINTLTKNISYSYRYINNSCRLNSTSSSSSFFGCFEITLCFPSTTFYKAVLCSEKLKASKIIHSINDYYRQGSKISSTDPLLPFSAEMKKIEKESTGEKGRTCSSVYKDSMIRTTSYHKFERYNLGHLKCISDVCLLIYNTLTMNLNHSNVYENAFVSRFLNDLTFNILPKLNVDPEENIYFEHHKLLVEISDLINLIIISCKSFTSEFQAQIGNQVNTLIIGASRANALRIIDENKKSISISIDDSVNKIEALNELLSFTQLVTHPDTGKQEITLILKSVRESTIKLIFSEYNRLILDELTNKLVNELELSAEVLISIKHTIKVVKTIAESCFKTNPMLLSIFTSNLELCSTMLSLSHHHRVNLFAKVNYIPTDYIEHFYLITEIKNQLNTNHQPSTDCISDFKKLCKKHLKSSESFFSPKINSSYANRLLIQELDKLIVEIRKLNSSKHHEILKLIEYLIQNFQNLNRPTLSLKEINELFIDEDKVERSKNQSKLKPNSKKPKRQQTLSKEPPVLFSDESSNISFVNKERIEGNIIQPIASSRTLMTEEEFTFFNNNFIDVLNTQKISDIRKFLNAECSPFINIFKSISTAYDFSELALSLTKAKIYLETLKDSKETKLLLRDLNVFYSSFASSLNKETLLLIDSLYANNKQTSNNTFTTAVSSLGAAPSFTAKTLKPNTHKAQKPKDDAGTASVNASAASTALMASYNPSSVIAHPQATAHIDFPTVPQDFSFSDLPKQDKPSDHCLETTVAATVAQTKAKPITNNLSSTSEINNLDKTINCETQANTNQSSVNHHSTSEIVQLPPIVVREPDPDCLAMYFDLKTDEELARAFAISIREIENQNSFTEDDCFKFLSYLSVFETRLSTLLLDEHITCAYMIACFALGQHLIEFKLPHGSSEKAREHLYFSSIHLQKTIILYQNFFMSGLDISVIDAMVPYESIEQKLWEIQASLFKIDDSNQLCKTIHVQLSQSFASLSHVNKHYGDHLRASLLWDECINSAIRSKNRDYLNELHEITVYEIQVHSNFLNHFQDYVNRGRATLSKLSLVFNEAEKLKP